VIKNLKLYFSTNNTVNKSLYLTCFFFLSETVSEKRPAAATRVSSIGRRRRRARDDAPPAERGRAPHAVAHARQRYVDVFPARGARLVVAFRVPRRFDRERRDACFRTMYRLQDVVRPAARRFVNVPRKSCNGYSNYIEST